MEVKFGLPEKIYTYKPTHDSNFKYKIEHNFNKEPRKYYRRNKTYCGFCIQDSRNISKRSLKL